MSAHYLGYRGVDADTPWGEWFRPEMAPLPDRVRAALALGPQAEPLFPDVDEAPAIVSAEHRRADAGPALPWAEDGYTVGRDGSVRVAVATDMPGVTPPMWDWWFGWHGCDARRYKLWHPLAHVSASWADGDDEPTSARNAGRSIDRLAERYVGRTSIIREYLGATYAHAAIAFVDPADLGIGAAQLSSPAGDGLAVCARLGDATRPVDVGWFVHHLLPTPEGCVMRSRFWLGGRHIAVRGGRGRVAAGLLDRVAAPVAGRLLGADAASAAELLIHCSQEMSHLASFLPELYDRFGDQ